MKTTTTFIPAHAGGTMCNCIIAKQPKELQQSIHYGAHEMFCPWYRLSRDPVDASHDAELRLRLKMQLATSN